MGYMMVFAPCFNCGKPFGFNANKVPSVRDNNGERQPVCKECIKWANGIRKEKGLPLFDIHPEAYEPEELA